MAERARLTLTQAIARLRKLHGRPEKPPTRDPFGLVIYENVVYLAPPERRRRAFEELRETVGTSPEEILGARRSVLEKIAARGIIAARVASRLQECARIAVEEFGGDLSAVIAGPMKDAIRALRRFPGIGLPGAEKILLFSGRAAGLAPESNALRVLVRLGLVQEGSSYAQTYASGRSAGAALPPRLEAFQEAHLLLQLHGQTLCRNNDPACDRCPLSRVCTYALGLAPPARPRVGSRLR